MRYATCWRRGRRSMHAMKTESFWRIALEHYKRSVWEVLTENNIDLSQPADGECSLKYMSRQPMDLPTPRSHHENDCGQGAGQPEGDTPLMSASRYGMAETLKVMQPFFQEANQKNKFGQYRSTIIGPFRKH